MTPAIIACLVLAIHDGDTLRVQCPDPAVTVIRVAEVDAPERPAFGWGLQPFALEARDEAIRLCGGQVAIVAITGRDRYGRTLAHVQCREIDLSQDLVEKGLAWPAYTESTSVVSALADMARRRGIGLWADPNAINPADWRHRSMR